MLRSTIMSHAEKNRQEYRFKQLQDLEIEIPWDSLVEAISSHYHSSNIGRLVASAESMLRIYFLQHRYGMSAAVVEDALFQLDVLRDFALIDDVIPNESCIEEFDSLVIANGLKSSFDQAFNIKAITTENSAEA